MLSIHLSGGRCRVGCPFCYLGHRQDDAQGALALGVLEQAAGPGGGLRPREIAVAVNEPVEEAVPALRRIASLGGPGRPDPRPARLTVTTTLAGAAALPDDVLALADRLSLSLDPFKGEVTAAGVAAACAALRRRWTPRSAGEIVLIVTLSTQRFARRLLDGLLADLLDLPEVDRVAWNGLKPPPPWCDRRFWLRALAQAGPLLRRHLDRRLFLDCYVAARILGIGGCPARPDLSPAEAPGAVAFRSCVYQPAPDFVVRDGRELAPRLQGFTPPAECPFEIR